MTSTQDKPKNFMQELDQWAERAVIIPLINSAEPGPNENFEKTIQQVKKAIRGKVLESYHNGQKRPAGAVRPRG